MLYVDGFVFPDPRITSVDEKSRLVDGKRRSHGGVKTIVDM
jgi:hypothetical protein